MSQSPPQLPPKPSDSKSYYCSKCKRIYGSHQDQCKQCKAWHTVVPGRPAGAGTHAFDEEVPQKLSEVKNDGYIRIPSGTRELDRVLGGGLVLGSVGLIYGDPGIGKSTLTLQSLMDLTIAEVTHAETNEKVEPFKAAITSAEENNKQILNRAQRLGRSIGDLRLYHQNNVIEIEKFILDFEPDVWVVDSIQMMYHPEFEGTAGSVSQIKACTSHIVGLCKSRGVCGIIIAHITKDGIIAGPKTLEHLVDWVMGFHKETYELRSLRADKNRFGSSEEMALFRMTRGGLRSVENPSELLLRYHRPGDTGSCIAVGATGPRAYMVEVQSLIDPISPPEKGPTRPGKRYVKGLSQKNVTQLLAVLSRHTDVDLGCDDLYLNIGGGVNFAEDQGLDLPTALSIMSIVYRVALPEKFCAFGEVGLAGEIRPVQYMEARIRHAALMGFEQIVGPVIDDEEEEEEVDLANVLPQSEPPPPRMRRRARELEAGEITDGMDRYHGVSTLEELLELFDVTKHKEKPKQGKLLQRRKKAKKTKENTASAEGGGQPEATGVTPSTVPPSAGEAAAS